MLWPMLDHNQYAMEHADPPVSVSHLVRTLGAYLPVITLSILAVLVGYMIVAATAYLLAPSQRVTSLPFRLEFQGADRGEYPNGTKFSGAEIVSTPIVLKVFNQNRLNRFVPFSDFASSLIVLASNRSQEDLAREYQARLSDPKLTSVDRDRIQREYELKLDSLSKDQYSINYVGAGGSKNLPDTVVRKVLHDVLREWANFVTNEHRVLQYRVTVLSPDIVAAAPANDNPVIAAEILRRNILRVLGNIIDVRNLASSELIRTADGLSLDDISFRLDEMVRFRLEPLVHRIAAADLDNRAETLRFLESQLAYDERQLQAHERVAESTAQTLDLYQNVRRESTPTSTAEPTSRPAAAAGQETVMPQISDTFIERLVQLTSSAADAEYRQKLADDYHAAALRIIPLQEAAAYDRSVLATVRTAGGGDGITREMVAQEINATRAEVRSLVVKVHEIHRSLSRSLNPEKELITSTGPQTTRIERAVSIKRLSLYGILTCLLALPVIVILCLLHNRVREEERDLVSTSRDAAEISV